MAPVVIIFNTSFCAVPAFIRDEPVTTSGPTIGVMAISARCAMGLSGLQLIAPVTAPSERAYSNAPIT